MPAVQETIDRVKRIDVSQYKYGFATEVEMDKAPKGLSEDIVRYISEKKGEPAWMLEWRLDAYRLRRYPLLRRAEEERRAEVPRRGRSRDPRDLQEARHPASRAGDSCRRP